MKNFIFFPAAVILFSCSGKNKVPEDIIQQKQMQTILWDVIRAQALSEELARKDSTTNAVTENKLLTQKVFEIHNITSSAFEKSYSWYTSHPEMMRIIFDSMNSQNQRQNEYRLKESHMPKESPLRIKESPLKIKESQAKNKSR